MYVKKVKPEKYKVRTGCPKDSVLGPMLFILFCYGIYKIIGNCETLLFIDDTTLFHSNKKDISYSIQ